MQTEQNNSVKKERPQQLTILCIFSFIGGGASLLSNFMIYSLFDQFKEYFKDGATQKILGSEIDMGFILNIDPNFFLGQIIFYSFSILGVFFMWKGSMKGFHIYSISQILLLIIPEIYVPSLPFPLFEILLTIVFILLYFKNLKSIEK
jgi:hypothetical protein